MDALPVSLTDIRAAREVLRGIVRETPMEPSRALSEHLGAAVHLKCENLQRAGSFKIRGAYTRMSRLTADEKARGVVAASAGNHAQGVALAAQLLGISATVFMPTGAPLPKLAATRGYGADVILHGTTLDEALVEALAFAERTGAILIHPFDHADIVAGQGTCGLEILEQVPDVQTIVCATGGGGLVAGIAAAVKAQRPDVRIIGVQAEQAAAWPLSLAAGAPVALTSMQTMADGIAVGRPGPVPFAVVSSLVDEIHTVTEAGLSRAVVMLLERAKLVAEPAGAAAVAWLIESGMPLTGPVVAVISGGNIDPLLMLRIVRHGLTAAGRFLEIAVQVPDRPGSLARLIADLAECQANVVEVNHVRTTAGLAVDEVQIAVEVETRGTAHRQQVLTALRDKGYRLVFGS